MTEQPTTERRQTAELHDLPEDGEGLRLGWVVAILLAVGMVGYMIFDGFKSETYFYEVHQAVAQGKGLIGQEVRLKGVVEPGSIVGKDGELGRAFRISEKGKSIKVYYDKALPDTFQEGMEVVAQGTVDDAYVLQANEVVVKCPSRYEGAPPTSHPKDIPMKKGGGEQASLDGER